MIGLYDFEARYKIGKPIFDKIFSMPYKDIQNLLQRMFPDLDETFKFEKTKVEKITEDDKPDKLFLYYYGKMEISPFGIYYTPEHKESIHLRYFDEFFKLGD